MPGASAGQHSVKRVKRAAWPRVALAGVAFGAAACRSPSNSEPVTASAPWRAALSRGVPALSYAPSSDRERASAGIVEAERLRAGVYLHDERRFVPLTPPVPGATSALVDPSRERALVIRMQITDCRADFCPGVSSVAVTAYDLSAASRAPVLAIEPVEGPFNALEVQATPYGARMQLGDCRYAQCTSGWLRVSGDPPLRDAEQRRLDGFLLDVRYRGTLLTYLEPGYSIRNGILQGPGLSALVLPDSHAAATHHSLLVEPRRQLALLVSVRDGCECDPGSERALLDHSVSRIELGTGRAQTLFRAGGAAAALLDAGGAVYLQARSRVERWPSIGDVGKRAPDVLPAGILLAAPRVEEQNCCGL